MMRPASNGDFRIHECYAVVPITLLSDVASELGYLAHVIELICERVRRDWRRSHLHAPHLNVHVQDLEVRRSSAVPWILHDHACNR
jgi:hypothetical protein